MAASSKTPYQLLDAPENTDYVKLRQFYRQKIHEHLQKKISAVNFRRICRAYETLSDYTKCENYKTKKEWVSDLPINEYTPQQLAAEPDLIRDLRQRLRDANLRKLNAQDHLTGHTVLYTAARAGNVEAVKFLTEQGAEPDLPQRTKSTALHVASFYGHADIVRFLLESGADYRIENYAGSTAEQEAFNDDVRKVFAELKLNDYVRVAANELDWFNKNGLKQHQDAEFFSQRQTLLHCAAKKGHFELARWLIEKCMANMDLVDFNGNTALHLAAYGGHKDIVTYLLNRGCDSTIKNRWGTTAEEEGAGYGNDISSLFDEIRAYDKFKMAWDGVDWWFYYYFNEMEKDSCDYKGISLLYYACRCGHYNVAKWLLEHGADVNIQMKQKPYSTALHGAKYHGHYLIVELLLEYNADVNIKNEFTATVFEEDISKEVDSDSVSKIKEILYQYQRKLTSNNLIDVHVYDDDGDKDEPVVKTRLSLTSSYEDLLSQLSELYTDQYPYLSMARRLLVFAKEDKSFVSTICRARYAFSKFIDSPIRLVRHKTKPKGYNTEQSNHQELKVNLRDFTKNLDRFGTKTGFSLKVPLNEKKEISINDLIFTFSENSIKQDVDIEITTLFKPDFKTFQMPGCLYLFKIETNTPKSIFNELPLVSMSNEPEARFYSLAQPSSYWFSSHTRRTRLPMIDGLHAFIRHIDIIPKHLSLPGDMFMASTLEQPLLSRDHPVPCEYIMLRKHDSKMFPHIAYHGTSINIIQSIIHDGLVTPGTVTAGGKRVNPPKNHFARDRTYFGVDDFASAVFLSPSIYYSSDPVYAIPFSHGDKQLIPILECSVKSNSYQAYRSTVSAYKAHPGDDINAIEWRITDPKDVEIIAVLFITTNESISASKIARVAKVN